MALLNLTVAQLLAIFIPLTGMLVALYFYNRRRRRVVVSTLRFWPRRPAAITARRQRQLQQPWSLLLQWLAVALLLLAIADLRWGLSSRPTRHHVVILDTSAWMAAVPTASGAQPASPGSSTSLMEAARLQALAYLQALPNQDRVMLIRADAVPTPATGFTDDRQALAEAIRLSEPGWTALDLGAALELARNAMDVQAEQGGLGEVVVVSSGRLAAGGDADASSIPFLRFIPIESPAGDAGIRRLSAARGADDSARWQVLTEIENDSPQPRSSRLVFSFNQKPLGERAIQLPANKSEIVSFQIKTTQAGSLEAALLPGDEFPPNNQAAIDIPSFRPRPVLLYSSDPNRYRALLTSAPNVAASLQRPSQFEPPSDADVVLLFDRFVPAALPRSNAVFFDPPPAQSPLRIASEARDARIVRWSPGHPLAAGLHDADVRLRRTSVFTLEPGDVAVAECDAGPVIVARADGAQRVVYFGFSLTEADLAERLVTPLLFANMLRWLAPEVLRHAEIASRPPGIVDIELPGVPPAEIEVKSAENPSLAWVPTADGIRFYAPRLGTVTVRTPDQELRLSLSLPESGGIRWEPPPDVRRGVPPPAPAGSFADAPLWPWLALAAIALLAVDWRFFGRSVFLQPAVAEPAPSSPSFRILDLGGKDGPATPSAKRVLR